MNWVVESCPTLIYQNWVLEKKTKLESMSLKLDVWGLTTEFVEVESRINIFKCVLYVERLNLHHENASIHECT